MSSMVSVRTELKFARAVCSMKGETGSTPWIADRRFFNEIIEAYRLHGWTILYIVTCQLHPKEPTS